jgi:antitoxin component YwqK of YwqJK toxin-antitoxin module
MKQITTLLIGLFICTGSVKAQIELILADEAWLYDDHTRQGIQASDYKNDTLKAFFDENRNKSRNIGCFYYTLAYKTRDGWVAEDYDVFDKTLIQYAVYADPALQEPDGTFMRFYKNGNVMRSGLYRKGKKHGLWIFGDRYGNPVDSIIFRDGSPVGKAKRYYPSGKLKAAIEFSSQSKGACTYTAYFESGELCTEGKYRRFPRIRSDEWNFYHKNGQLYSSISFPKDTKTDQFDATTSAIHAQVCYDSTGRALADCIVLQPAQIEGGKTNVQQFIDRNWSWPRNYKFERDVRAVLQISFTVNIDGSVTDLEIDRHIAPEFDAYVRRLIQTHPIPFSPAIHQGVPTAVRQVWIVRFTQY